MIENVSWMMHRLNTAFVSMPCDTLNMYESGTLKVSLYIFDAISKKHVPVLEICHAGLTATACASQRGVTGSLSRSDRQDNHSSCS